MTKALRAPFPYFGGKSMVAATVWERFGNTPNYVEPFAGSLAVLLARPHRGNYETVNDADGFVVNFWRAVQAAPDSVAGYASYPPFESDVHARSAWLVEQREGLTAALEADPEFFDARVAGWWVWTVSLLIGDEAALHRTPRSLPAYGSRRGVHSTQKNIPALMAALCERLRHVRVACGDWSRVVKPSLCEAPALPVAVFLDPPYGASDIHQSLYAYTSATTASEVRAWAVEHGDNPAYRIALCGYRGEGHEELTDLGWSVHEWQARGGYGNQGKGNANRFRETIWFSPHCLPPASATLFDRLTA
ncbi:DNA adenine methylase [Dermabacteraceae bacterium TAE3-ERU27]|nr:DNA adenine methylase [Dermabacteraceae bacterium TAE3-ERU27]